MKPSLFKNELLATSDALNTWVFEGLWCIADREGRLEDRPRRIHLEINPGRAYETTETALAWLAEHGFIIRYTHGSDQYIQVVNFGKHQNPHPREVASVIPGPGLDGKHDSHINESSVPGNGEAQPRPCLGMDEQQASPALSSFPLPDSPSLNPLPLGESAHARRPRPAKRVPADFQLTSELRAWAADKFPGVNADAETEAFRDHEFANARSDWPATWRSWIRRAAKFTGTANGATPPRKLTRYEQIFGREDVEIVDDPQS